MYTLLNVVDVSQRLKERQIEGIAEAKKRGVYKSNGGKQTETKTEFLNKSKNHTKVSDVWPGCIKIPTYFTIYNKLIK